VIDQTLARVQELVKAGDYLVSEHGREELASDDINTAQAVSGVRAAEVVEKLSNGMEGP
jgi:hypothetical protein